MSEENTENQEQQSEQQAAPENQGDDSNAISMDDFKELQESVKKLEAKNKELIAEKREQQQKRQDAEADAKKAAEEKARQEGDFKQLYESALEELEGERKKSADLQEQTVKGNIRTKASEIAHELTKHAGRAEDLTDKIAGRLKLVDGELKVLDKDGHLTVSSLEDLKNDMASRYDWLVDGSQASGGNAGGNKNPTAPPKVNQAAQAAKEKGDVHGYLKAALSEHINGGMNG